MRLKTKISVILLVLWLVMLFVTYAGSKFILTQSYLDLENKESNNNLQRITETIQQMNATVSTVTTNWAIWDDTYQFVMNKNPEYKKINLVVNSLVSANVNMMLYFNIKGQWVDGMAVDLEKSVDIPLPKKLFDYLTPRSLLVYQPNIESQVAGLISIPDGILLIAAHAIVTSDNKGPVQGTLIMGRYLSADLIKKLQMLTKLDVNIYQLSNRQVSVPMQNLYQQLIKNNQPIIQRINEKTIIGYSLLKDIYGEPIAIIKCIMPRNVYQIGIKTIEYYNTLFVIYSLIVIFLLWQLLQKIFVRRLENLKNQMGNSEKNYHLEKIIYETQDEVSTVSTLYHQATHDPLTGLANRNLLDQFFNKQINQLKSTDNKIALLFLDIDYFKRINDSLGHDVGDMLLISISQKINACLRECDLAARIGGDEFILIIPNVDIITVNAIVERIYQVLSQPIIIHHHELYLTTSMGISIYPNDGDNMTILLKNADIALYHVKEHGRNNFQFYSYELNQIIIEANKKGIELQRAIDNKELRLYYQPIYNVTTHQIVSIEVLLRWQHPTRGLLTAAEVIPYAEKTGLIVPIGQWILTTACQQAKIWHNKKLLMAPIAVNISLTQIKNNSLHGFVTNALSLVDLSPKLLELELTETSYIEINDRILNDMKLLKEKGVNLIVDDFGVGYSVFGYLKRLPISKIKIDKSFIDDLVSNEDSQVITSAIISIAHQLNLQVIAEGIENKEQLEFLTLHDVDAVQGFFLCEPLSDIQIEALLQNNFITNQSSNL